MKRKFSKILGVGLTLALLTSLVLVAAPVSALTQPSVTLDDYQISATGVEYGIIFAITEDLDQGEDIIIEFPAGTDISAVDVGDVTIGATSGIGSGAFGGAVPDSVSIDGQELTITLDTPVSGTETKIGVGATVQVLVDDVDNPDVPGDYTLDVSTTDEATVTSGPYEIVVPDIGALPGIVSLYNPNGILMNQYTGAWGIQDAIDAAGEDYIIKIGPGTYEWDIYIYVPGLTLEATRDVEDTVIEGDVVIDEDGITLDSLTIVGGYDDVGGPGPWGTFVMGNTTITDCIFEKGMSGDPEYLVILVSGDSSVTDCVFDTTAGSEDDVGIGVSTDDCTISGCSFTLDFDDVGVGVVSDTTIEDCDFTGSSGIGVELGDGDSTIKDCTFDGLEHAIVADNYWGDPEALITGNDIMNSTGDAILIDDSNDIVIVNNNISDTDEDYYAVLVTGDDDEVYVLFNNFTGNELNVNNDDGSDTLNASHNWWGAAAGPASGSTAGDVDTSAYLGAPITNAVVVLGETSLDAKTAAGVKISDATGASIIGAAAYSDNPQEAIADALAFYDVYVAGATDDPLLKFYAGDENSKLYAWSADTDIWVSQTCSFSAFGGYVYATVDADLLEGTPFVVVDVEPTPATLAAPVITAPASGDDTVSLTPTFAWSAVTGADGYYFEFADNANFVLTLAKLVGDGNRLIVTAYHYATELDYSTSYYWRVKAVSGTEGAGDLVESAWVSGVFITIAEPVEPEPEVWSCPQCGLTFDTREALAAHAATAHPAVEPADIVITSPDIIVPLPAETPITPAWIYVIIGVGAVLVIALLVLIVRTRRVA